MGITIDDLQIEITENSAKAIDGLEALTKSLNKLKKTTSGLESSLKGVNFKEFNNQMKELSTAMKPLDGFKTQVGTVINSLRHFSKTATEFNKLTGFEKFSEQILLLADSLKPFTTMGKSQLGSILNQLKKFPEVMREFSKIDSKEIERFAERIKEAVVAIKPLADEMNKIAAGFSAFPSRIQRLIQQNDRLVKSNTSLGKSYNLLGISFKSIHLKMAGLFYVARKLAKGMSDWVMESTAYVENLNLFRISMRGASDEALDFAFKVREVFGIDPSEWIRFQAVFQNMATGFGIAADKATTMSKNLTQLGYDLATVFNVNYEIAMQKLQSALAGQPRPMREWGFDMSEATLKLVALRHGVEKNVETMTQYEKSQLRFLQIMETAHKQGIVQNFARELHTPANALRILNQQLLFFKRTLGDAIIPLLIKILPYLQALVIVMTNVARAVASVMGFELPIIDYSGLGAASGYADDLEDGLEGSTEKAKALKRALASFDEINLLQDPTGAGANLPEIGGGLDLDLHQFDYDFLGEIQNRAKEIADKLQEPFENMLKLAIEIGVIMLAWKIADKVYSFFKGDTLSNFAKVLSGMDTTYVPFMATLAVIVGRFIELYKKSEKFRLGLKTLGKEAKSTLNWLIETGLPETKNSLGNLIPPSVKTVTDKVFKPMQKAIQALDIDFSDLLIPVSSLAMLLNPTTAPFGVALLIFEGITLAIRGIGYASSPAIEGIEVLGDGISDVTKQKMKPFLDRIGELELVLKDINWRKLIINDSTFMDIENRLKEVTQMILDELDADRNSALKKLEPLKYALGEETYNELISKNEKYYDDMRLKVIDGEAEILKIMNGAREENRTLTEDEYREIAKLKEKMKEAAIRHLSETDIESQKILNRLKDSATKISADMAIDIIKNAEQVRSDTIAAAMEQYTQIEFEAQRMLDVGAINKEEYQKIMDAAKEARNRTIEDAQSQYSDIEDIVKDKLGETAKYIDFETGEIKSKWQVFTENLKTNWSERWDEIKKKFDSWKTSMGEGLESFKTDFKRKWCSFWNGIGNFFIDAWNGIVGGLESAINKVIGGLNELLDSYNDVVSKIPRIGDKITISTISKVSFDRVPRLDIPQFSLGGFPDLGQLFIAREAGPEMVGSIGNRTAVANNEQIVEAVSTGVYEAMMAAMQMGSGSSDSKKEFVFNVNGRQFARAVLQDLNEEAQRMGFNPLLRYEGGR